MNSTIWNGTLRLAAVFAVGLGDSCTASATPGESVAIVHGRLLTISHGIIEDGVLVMSQGRIAAVGEAGTRVPPGARVYDASGMVVYPGLFDVESSIGLVEPDSPQRASARQLPPGTPTPYAMIADAIHPTDYIDVERLNGITHSVVSAGKEGPLPGHSAMIQLVDDREAMIVRRDAGLVINFEGRRGDAYPTTVFGIVGYVRQLLTRARELATSGATPSPGDSDAAEFIPYLEGRRRIIAHVKNDAQVGDALDLADEFGLELILCGLTRIDTSLERIAAAKVPVVVGMLMEEPRPGKRFDHVFRLPGRLAALGVPLSMATLDAMPGGVRNLPYLAGTAASFGLSREDALRAITLAPAQAFGVGEEFGSLEIGKVANVVIANGDPLEVTTQVTQVFVRGEALPMTNRQTRLRERYDVPGTPGLPRAVERGRNRVAPGATPPEDTVIANGTLMTVSHGTIARGTIWIHDGKIAAVGESVPAPAHALVIDAGGRYVTPGIIDAHAHIGEDGLGNGDDSNEYQGKLWGSMAGPNQADLQVRDSIQTDAYAFYLLLSSGQTTALNLPGSANLFGGQAAPMKLKVGRPREEMFIEDAPVAMKISCGATPAREWRGRGVGIERDADVSIARRKAYDEARAYRSRQEAHERAVAAGDARKVPPPVDLKMEALLGILGGTTLVHLHCHAAQNMLEELAVARDYGHRIHTIHHGTEAYKIAGQIAAADTGVLGATDWWGGSSDTADGIPWNLSIGKKARARVAIHGEVTSVARRLSQEAGKMIRYEEGIFTRDEALALVTAGPAWVMGLEDRLGSIDVGKDADIVIWNGDPLSSYGHASKVFIEGELYFDASLPGLGLVQGHEGVLQP